jgi:hypothetical protein
MNVFELLGPLLLLLVKGLVEGRDGMSEITLEFISHPLLLLVEIHLDLPDEGFDLGDGSITRILAVNYSL